MEELYNVFVDGELVRAEATVGELIEVKEMSREDGFETFTSTPA